jgi:hypothetical protein
MMLVMAHTLSIIEIRRIAVELECDPRSVESEINGRRVRGVVGERIRRHLETRGFGIQSLPGSPPAMAGAVGLHRGGRPF